MNYEQKYKEALERATFYNNELPTKEQRKMLLDIFPELKESEDERIRKKLISFVENWKNFRPNSPFDDYAVYTSDSGECDEILAWLEKQGEKKTEMIDKACEWLRNNLRNYVVFDPDGVVCFGHWENDFRNAMKGDE